MTLDELLGKSVEELEALSDTELEQHVKHYFEVTRPESVANKQARERSNARPRLKSHGVNSMLMTNAMGILASKGVDPNIIKQAMQARAKKRRH